MHHKSKNFKELQKSWYNRLKEAGFEDIEQDDSHLKWSASQNLTRTSNRNKEVFFKSIEHYFRLAGYFRYDHVFTSKTDELVWTLHSDGKTMREISITLRNYGISRALTQVKEIIHKLRRIMYRKYEDLDNEQE